MHKWISTKTAAVSGGALIMQVNSFNKAALLTALLEGKHWLKHRKRLRAMVNKERQKASKWMKAERSWMLVVLWLNSPNRGITSSSDHQPSELFGFICFLHATQETNDAALVLNYFWFCVGATVMPQINIVQYASFMWKELEINNIFGLHISSIYLISILLFTTQVSWTNNKNSKNSIYTHNFMQTVGTDTH